MRSILLGRIVDPSQKDLAGSKSLVDLAEVRRAVEVQTGPRPVQHHVRAAGAPDVPAGVGQGPAWAVVPVDAGSVDLRQHLRASRLAGVVAKLPPATRAVVDVRPVV